MNEIITLPLTAECNVSGEHKRNMNQTDSESSKLGKPILLHGAAARTRGACDSETIYLAMMTCEEDHVRKLVVPPANYIYLFLVQAEAEWSARERVVLVPGLQVRPAPTT